MITHNAEVQQYYNNTNANNSTSLYLELKSITSLSDDINFITIIDKNNDAITAINRFPIYDTLLGANITSDYEEAIHIRGNGIKILNNTNYSLQNISDDELSLYFPIYSTHNLDEEIALLCINLKQSSILPSLYSREDDLQFYLSDSNGNIFSNADIQTVSNVDIKLGTTQFTSEGVYLSYKIPEYSCYYIIKINWWSLFESGIILSIIIGILFALIIFFMLESLKRMIAQSYAPWNTVIAAMKSVISGNMDTRIPSEETDIDMKTVCDGFNLMLDTVNDLLSKVSHEEYKLAEAEFSIAQTQIQPHFLYNTLECIHWQAIADGNKKISTMIKALASYYRTCLSKGKAIITWKEELELTKNYLIIQKMRYEEILDYKFSCDESLNEMMIPKLTLQPLVENSIYHGIKSLDNRNGFIHIEAYQTDHEICIKITDNGMHLSNDSIDRINEAIRCGDEGFGFGIRNVHYRLLHRYGDKFKLFYSLNPKRETQVTISLPILNHRKVGTQYDKSTNC